MVSIVVVIWVISGCRFGCFCGVMVIMVCVILINLLFRYVI